MYEQDYIIRMNNEVIRTMVKVLLNKGYRYTLRYFRWSN